MRQFIKSGLWRYGVYTIKRQSADNKSYRVCFARYRKGKFIDAYFTLKDAEAACESQRAGDTSAITASPEMDGPSAR